MSILNGASITSGVTSNLNATYSILANASNGNVSMNSLNDALSNPSYASALNLTFANHLLSNFSKYDKDGDGKIAASEMQASNTSLASTGLSRNDLMSLGTASGLSSKALSDVLNHFQAIDVNGDGKITTAEINAFNYTSAAEKKKIEFSNKFASDMSIYYGSDNNSSDSSSSLLSSKFLSDD